MARSRASCVRSSASFWSEGLQGCCCPKSTRSSTLAICDPVTCSSEPVSCLCIGVRWSWRSLQVQEDAPLVTRSLVRPKTQWSIALPLPRRMLPVSQTPISSVRSSRWAMGHWLCDRRWVSTKALPDFYLNSLPPRIGPKKPCSLIIPREGETGVWRKIGTPRAVWAFLPVSAEPNM